MPKLFDMSAFMGATRMKKAIKSPSARRTAFVQRPRNYVVPRQNPALSPKFMKVISGAWKKSGWTK